MKVKVNDLETKTVIEERLNNTVNETNQSAGADIISTLPFDHPVLHPPKVQSWELGKGCRPRLV